MEEIDLKQLFNILYRKKIYIIIITLVFIIIGIIYSYKFVVPQYKSKTTIVLTKTEETSKVIVIGDKDTGITQADLDMNSKLVKTYSELAKNNSVLEKVAQNLDLDLTASDISKMLTVNDIKDTDIIEICVKNEDAILAKNITNQVAIEFTEKVKELYNIDNLKIVDEAKAATSPCNINHIKDIAIFSFIGLVVSFAYILICNMFSNTIKNSEEIIQKTDLNLLQEMPNIEEFNSRKKKKKELVVYEDAKNPYSEIIKKLRTKLQYAMEDEKAKTILITSTIPGEGKSFIASNLAVSFSQVGFKVALVDADMRKGRQHKIFHVDRAPGLSNYLSGINEYGVVDSNKTVTNHFQKTDIENLSLLACGSSSANPSEILATERFEIMINELKNSYDIIILDGTPSAIVTDSAIVSRMADITLLVEEINVAKIDDILRVKKEIEEVGGNIIGVVLNKTKSSKRNYNYSYKYYIDDNLPTTTKKVKYVKKQ